MVDQHSAEIVESPITTVKIEAAMVTARAATGFSGPILMTSFNQGRSILITTSIEAALS